MTPTLVIEQNFNHFGDIAAKAMAEMAQAVREAGEDVRQDAASNAPVDTSALQKSLYVSDDQRSDYSTCAAQAVSMRHAGNRPSSPAVIVPEVRPIAPMESVVGSAVAHALMNEMGTIRVPPRPFLAPAVASAAPKFFQKIGDALK